MPIRRLRRSKRSGHPALLMSRRPAALVLAALLAAGASVLRCQSAAAAADVSRAGSMPDAPPVPADAAGDAVRQQINDETASLTAMAYALKSAVDQTGKDELSVTVVRQAARIEQLARKVRDEIRPQIKPQVTAGH